MTALSYFGSTLLTAVFSPLGIFLITALVVLVFPFNVQEKKRRYAAIFTVFLFAAACTDFFGRAMLMILESLAGCSGDTDKGSPAVTLVLGGGAVAEGDLYQPSVSSQRRMRKALEVHHSHENDTLLISGIEAPLMEKWLKAHSFSGKCLIEGKSLNTQENIRQSARLLNGIFPDESTYPVIYLVTDKFHITRAMLWARVYLKEFDIIPAPAPSMVRRSGVKAVQFIPTCRGLDLTSMACREMIALMRDYLKIKLGKT